MLILVSSQFDDFMKSSRCKLQIIIRDILYVGSVGACSIYQVGCYGEEGTDMQFDKTGLVKTEMISSWDLSFQEIYACQYFIIYFIHYNRLIML